MSDNYILMGKIKGNNDLHEIARNMAKLDDKGFCEYVYDKVKADKKIERGR